MWNVEVTEMRIRFLHSVDFTPNLWIHEDALNLKRDTLGLARESKY